MSLDVNPETGEITDEVKVRTANTSVEITVPSSLYENSSLEVGESAEVTLDPTTGEITVRASNTDPEA